MLARAITLWIFEQSSFFAHFMCFDVSALAPSDACADTDKAVSDGINECTPGKIVAQGNDVKTTEILSFYISSSPK